MALTATINCTRGGIELKGLKGRSDRAGLLRVVRISWQQLLCNGVVGRLVSPQVGHPPLNRTRVVFPSRLARPLDTSGPITCKVVLATAKRNIGGEGEEEGGEGKKNLNPTVARDEFRPHRSVLTHKSPERRLSVERDRQAQSWFSLSFSLSLSFQHLTGQQWRSLPPLHLGRVQSVQVQPDSSTRNDSLSSSPRARRAVFFFCCLCVRACVGVRRHVHAEVNKASSGTFLKASESQRRGDSCSPPRSVALRNLVYF